ncbi:Kinesin-like protein KIF15 [Morus notabilis]|uniref:Kinesin-like protein KIF15 n=1 Tax=Morus notabilis TaxID=981085 RepID=W9RIX1_9ROSA|nr:Kinesin-like protein KIF15 [Morus notabilis]
MAARNVSKAPTPPPEPNENHFETPPPPNLLLHCPLPRRSPLNTIADPSQTPFGSFDSKRRFSFSDRHPATPSKYASRASLAGPISASGIRASQRVPRPISVAAGSESETTPHFELQQDESFWADHNVQVLIRVRPLSRMERVSGGLGRCLRQESGQTLVWLGHPETRFTFDHVACDTISQESLFRVAGLPMVENCLSGYNSCMFAYGQTGSGKTYTMMGEINEIEGKLNEDCGLTPRIFEHLFKRIMAEEESRRDEQLKYSCKCSFLEIYNEQITDLLEPSSTNLQLREDLKKGVHVENLTEYNVRNVNDVVKLLLQGAANRKVAATYMNSESSRSHSVFTCTIESRWGKDSMTHFRFARLNLVDLAGSERQKSSGAEGDRLKEAANINKSLSTLGLVIMSLVDLAHGKHRHVPYRDSRLTFLLQGQLSFLMKRNYVSRSSTSCMPNFEESRFSEMSDEYSSLGDTIKTDSNGIQYVQDKIKRMEANLVGALRREKITETALQKLEAQLEHVKCLACQREDDAQHTKMMLRFRNEEIKRLELLTDGMLSVDNYLVQENKALLEEIQALRKRKDENPELTQYAVENNRLREQLQVFQSFYEHGERETLLAEVSELRNQLLDVLEGRNQFFTNNENQEYGSTKELEDCRIMNSKLIREVEELRMQLKKNMNCGETVSDSLPHSQVKSMSVQSDSGDETSSSIRRNDDPLQNHMDKNADDVPIMPSNVTEKELTDARLLIEEMKRDQQSLIIEQPNTQDKLEGLPVLRLGNRFSEFGDLDRQNNGLVAESNKEIDRMVLQAKLDRMAKNLQEVRLLNIQFQEEQALQLSCQQKAELIREQVEMETARTILQLQEEVAALQCKLDEKFCYMTEENIEQRKKIATKEEEIKAINMEWERATLELTGFLVEGSRSLKNVSSQIESIACSFPQANLWISEHVERAAKIYIEKEETILQLKRSLEDAQNMVVDMGQKLSSLKGVMLALTELQHQDNDEISKEHVSMLLNDKIDMVKVVEKKLKLKEAEVIEAEKCASVAFVLINWLLDSQKVAHKNGTKSSIPISTPVKMASHKISEAKTDADALALEDAMTTRVELARLGVLESESAINAFYADTALHMVALQTNVQEVSYEYKELVQNLVKEVREMREKYMELRAGYKNSDHCAVDTPSMQVYNNQKFEDQFHMLHQIKDELAKLNCTLKVIENFVHAEVNLFEYSSTDGGLHAEAWSPDSSSSSSDFSTKSDASGNKLDASSSICWSNSPEKISEQMVDLKFEGSTHRTIHQHSENPNKPLKDFCNSEAAIKLLKKELGILFNDFNTLYVQLAVLANELNLGHYPDPEGSIFLNLHF